jgi:ABC-type sugar transport system ATPase subunit
MANIKLDQVRKSFGKVDVIKGVDLDIKSREFVVFVGPSGCGKSTLLRLVAGLEDITSGTLSIDNQVVNELSPSTAASPWSFSPTRSTRT